MGTAIYWIGTGVILSVVLALFVNNWSKYRVLSIVYIVRLIIPIIYLGFAVRSLAIDYCPGFMCFFPSYMNYGLPWSLLAFKTSLNDPTPIPFVGVVINFLIIL